MEHKTSGLKIEYQNPDLEKNSVHLSPDIDSSSGITSCENSGTRSFKFTDLSVVNGAFGREQAGPEISDCDVPLSVISSKFVMDANRCDPGYGPDCSKVDDVEQLHVDKVAEECDLESGGVLDNADFEAERTDEYKVSIISSCGKNSSSLPVLESRSPSTSKIVLEPELSASSFDSSSATFEQNSGFEGHESTMEGDRITFTEFVSRFYYMYWFSH
jgi:hypothetical protein